ncbi:COPI associated [Ascobolus immersus RN42]|uniref:COPI associated n=1 Tax=Ascobolus immersus RN42 TaxID=1160509 RepID=A0A3N4IL35_ASCIM|nr:COPI associated [Ascobolus immersus RN42]
MDFSQIFRLVNIAVGAFMVLGGLSQYFPISIQSGIVGSFVILFGLGTALLEFQQNPIIAKYASFMYSFIGRGVFYLFAGAILMHDHWMRYTSGVIIAAVGVAYIVLEWIPSIEPPESMRDQPWDGEQV